MALLILRDISGVSSPGCPLESLWKCLKLQMPWPHLNEAICLSMVNKKEIPGYQYFLTLQRPDWCLTGLSSAIACSSELGPRTTWRRVWAPTAPPLGRLCLRGHSGPPPAQVWGALVNWRFVLRGWGGCSFSGLTWSQPLSSGPILTEVPLPLRSAGSPSGAGDPEYQGMPLTQ